MMNRNVGLLLLFSLLIMVSIYPVQPSAKVTAQETGVRCFDATGYCISGRIRTFWEQNGGLPVFGYPITAQEEMLIEGQPIEAQWFERNRLELHPQNDPPYDVLLGRLGPELLRINQGREWYEFPPDDPIGPQGRCFFRGETRQNICGNFLIAWQSNGLELDGVPGSTPEESLALFGLPLTSVITETLSDGNVYEVQYFERARFEYHPENDPPYNVLFGLLGNETYAIGQNVDQPPPSPTRVTAHANPEFLTVSGDVIYFAAEDDPHGRELWRSDGTPEGTYLVRDIQPGPRGSYPLALANINGTILFGAGDGSSETLWRSDGTNAGTLMVVDDNGDNISLFSRRIAALSDRVFFLGYIDVTDPQIWVSDGTANGTRSLTAVPGGIYPRYVGTWPQDYPRVGLASVGSILYFSGNTDDNPNNYALWRSDGTPAGTLPIANLVDGEAPREYWDMTDAGGTLLFVARTGETTYGLWRSDGTPEGTQLVRAFERPELQPRAGGVYPSVRIVAAVGSRVYMLVDNTTTEAAGLWTSDGTADGTFFVTADASGSTAIWNNVFYYLTLPSSGTTIELRRISDPRNAPETIARIPVQRGTTQLVPTNIKAAGGALYFALNDPGFELATEPVWPAELWRSDGSPEGTTQVTTIARSWSVLDYRASLIAPDDPTEIVEAGGGVYLVGDDGVHGRELWRTDGTADGTRLVYDINTTAITP